MVMVVRAVLARADPAAEVTHGRVLVVLVSAGIASKLRTGKTRWAALG